MKKLYIFIKISIQIFLLALAVGFIGSYLVLSTSRVQEKIRHFAVKELSGLLGTDVEIARVQLAPFNKAELFGVFVADQQGDTLLYASKIAAGIKLSALLDRQIQFSNIQLFGMDARIRKETSQSAANYQFIVDSLKSDKKKERNIDLRINSALVRRGKVSYHVDSEPDKPQGVFDPNHIQIKNLLATLTMKSLTGDSLNLFVKRLGFEEKSGFSLDRLRFRIEANRNVCSLSQIEIQLPRTQITSEAAVIDISQARTLSDYLYKVHFNYRINRANICLQDFAAFVPNFKSFTPTLLFSCDLSGYVNDLHINRMQFDMGNGDLSFSSKMDIQHLLNINDCIVHCSPIRLQASPKGLLEILSLRYPRIESSGTKRYIDALQSVHFDGDIAANIHTVSFLGNMESAQGSLHSNITLHHDTLSHALDFNGSLYSERFNLHSLLGESSPFGSLALNVTLDGEKLLKKAPEGKVEGEISYFDYKGYTYEHILLNGFFANNRYQGKLGINDPNGALDINGLAIINQEQSIFDLEVNARELDLEALQMLPKKFKGHKLSFDLDAEFTGNSLDNSEGILMIDSLSFENSKRTYFLDRFAIEAHNRQNPQSIVLSSDMLNGYIEGEYSFKTFKNSLLQIYEELIPSATNTTVPTHSNNSFYYQFMFEPNTGIEEIMQIPFKATHQIAVEGYLNDNLQEANFTVSSPGFRIKRKRFEDLFFRAQKEPNNAELSIEVNMFSKKGIRNMLNLYGNAEPDKMNVTVGWKQDVEKNFNGKFNTSTRFSKDDESGQLSVDVQINPSEFVFNDTIWNVLPSTVKFCDGKLQIDDFEVSHQQQYLRIDGDASSNPNDSIQLQLRDVNLDYIFDPLNIRFVDFGGWATGDFVITDLFSKIPKFETERFDVQQFAYNGTTLGSLRLYSTWNHENQGILMRGTVMEDSTRYTHVDGHIFPTKDSLSLSFDPHELKIDFLQPFLASIMDKVHGRASGHIDFFGKFKTLTVSGDAFLNDVALGIGYLNTVYTLTDSVHLTPTRIWFDDVTLSDKNKHTASASGWLEHKFFKDLKYDFRIRDARNFLGYDVTEAMSPTYFGTLYASGGATISGDSENTLIDVNVATRDKSKFTFVLSGTQSAGDFDFITFKDKYAETPEKEPEPIEEDIEYEEESDEKKARLRMALQIEATPEATMYLVMDPQTGDMIKANGEGSILLEYDGLNNDMKMYGNYTLNQGSYNFNLQDVISRDFSIKSGSSVSFTGDPMSATLDISAIYSLTASLTDLDASFATEKELTRTNVPVQTILNVTGGIEHPDLSFDIAFPTLTQDIDRRVKSIISTDDMMNRQIIYLLAINKFYTPDYMETDRNTGSEFVSVASSTLSAQLSSILGQISGNWNIAPNVRSEKGDFSDVEVEVALSSQLLNNRLLFNGNLGYRDNTMNNNSFIGDFDLEYLLTRNGNLRLKAYNHYNDQNYYIKSALTTQGVGILFKRDFTTWKELFDIKWRDQFSRRRSETEKAENASSEAISNDSQSKKKKKKKNRKNKKDSSATEPENTRPIAEM